MHELTDAEEMFEKELSTSEDSVDYIFNYTVI